MSLLWTSESYLPTKPNAHKDKVADVSRRYKYELFGYKH